MDISVINDDYQVSVTNNGNIVSIPVTNNSNDASIINAYVATYDQENVLSKISMGTATIDAGSSQTINIEYDELVADETAKLFIWADNNAPIVANVILNKETMPTEAPTDTPTETPTEDAGDQTSVYSGTPVWTVKGGSTEMRDNILYSDRTQTKTTSVHIQGGGSGDRYAYATIIPDGVTSDVKFTAVYEEDTSYIESIASVVVSGPESMTSLIRILPRRIRILLLSQVNREL